MRSPYLITGFEPVQKCERPHQITGRAPHSASEGEVLPTIPLAPFNPKQVPRDRQEYPVWQAVLRVEIGLTP
jgi:hypothetical protein